MKEFLSASASKAWEGLLNNLGPLVAAFLFSGSYMVALNKVQQFQDWVRSIPTDYVLTPLVLLVALLFVQVRIARKENAQLTQLERELPREDENFKYVTHLGVWWKIFEDSEYIEDFPYCGCCDAQMKLVQTDWHPDEKYICPNTKTEYQLFDRVPRERLEILDELYCAYFNGLGSLHEEALKEIHRVKELNPDADNTELVEALFAMVPLSRLPQEERSKILRRHTDPISILHFIENNLHYYKSFLKCAKDEENP